VNAKGRWDTTTLHLAARNGNVDILHLLVENGVDLDAEDDHGWSALHFAANDGHLPFVEELISRYHVDINARMNDGQTALSLARNHFFPHRTVITFLRANGGVDGVEEEEEEEEEIELNENDDSDIDSTEDDE